MGSTPPTTFGGWSTPSSRRARTTWAAGSVRCPAAPGPVPEAIALAMAHPFGVGNARFRTGADGPTWVDTVPFGCFRRSLFDRIGVFDPELARNQDDELNGRIIRAGGRILLLPDLAIDYFARGDARQAGADVLPVRLLQTARGPKARPDSDGASARAGGPAGGAGRLRAAGWRGAHGRSAGAGRGRGGLRRRACWPPRSRPGGARVVPPRRCFRWCFR